jgi:FkbM family methyltransferase
MSSEIRLVWDLGANVGITMRDLANRLPSAHIVGVELDDGNADMAVRNCSSIHDRSTVIRAAVWVEDGELTYRVSPGLEQATHVEAGGRHAETGAPHVAAALSLNSLLAETGPPDFIKMDIEGAEKAVLRENTEWAASARQIIVEVHESYTAEECEFDLRVLGFEVSRRPQTVLRPHAAVIGIRSVGGSKTF